MTKPLTKREFDRLTKTHGGTGKTSEWTGRRSSGLARDEVDYYRRSRHLPLRGSGTTESTIRVDLLAKRASERGRHPGVPLSGLQSAPKRMGGKAFLRSWGEPITRPIRDTGMALLSREEREAMGRATITAKDILPKRRSR